jgi:hypothetical protein
MRDDAWLVGYKSPVHILSFKHNQARQLHSVSQSKELGIHMHAHQYQSVNKSTFSVPETCQGSRQFWDNDWALNKHYCSRRWTTQKLQM